MGKELVKHSERAHALLSPSSAHRWINCPGSIELTKDIPETTNDAALAGTKLHEEAEKALLKYLETGERIEVSAKIHTYVSYVIEQYEYYSLLGDCVLHIEEKLVQQDFEGTDEDYRISGTVDCILETVEGLIVIDYKSGHHKVEAQKNYQLALYGIMAFQKFNRPIHKLVIVQNEIIEEWDDSWTDVFVIELQDRINQLQASMYFGDFKAGAWCQYCPGKFSCRAYANSVNPMVAQLPDPKTASTEELAKLYTISNFLSSYLKAVDKEVSNRVIEENIPLPGFKIIQGKGRRNWNVSDEEVLATLKKKGYKVSDITEKKLLSFTKIEKLDKKAKQLVDELTTKSAGSYKVVSNTAPGEAITFSGDDLPGID